ncbi:hypothetical protein ACROYT_G044390 [Oculina patagonica]
MVIRELAINLAKGPNCKVYCFVSHTDSSDMEDAIRNGVNLISATPRPGLDPLDWLKFPPPEIPHTDIVVGHGRKLGSAAYFMKFSTDCKWIQFVNDPSEGLGKYKVIEFPTRDVSHVQDTELCKAADKVVAVGPLLQEMYQKSLPDIKVEVITPGILEEFSSHLTQQQEKAYVLNVFVFGGGLEDLEIKGYDIIGNAIAALGEKFVLYFAGSSPGQHEAIMLWFQKKTKITTKQLTVRGYRTQNDFKDMLSEADVVALPSRTEGFGMIALGALSAGVPVLVSNQSGIAKALENVNGGDLVVVNPGNAKEWAEKIQKLSKQTREERLNDAKLLRENYRKTYSWSTQCKIFERMIQDLVEGPPSFNSTSGEIIERQFQMPPRIFGALFGSEDGSEQETESIASEVCKMSKETPNSSDTGFDEEMDINYTARAMDISCNEETVDPRQSVVTEKQLSDLSDDIATCWQKLGRKLGIEASTICNLDEEYRSDYDKANALLIMWKEQHGSGGLAGLLADALESIGRKSIAEKLLEMSEIQIFENKSLHLSALGGNIASIEKLLSQGCDINARESDEKTPLMIAACHGKAKVVSFLLKSGADAFLKSEDGSTLLHFASRGGNVTIIEEVVKQGLHIDSTDSVDNTPLMYAAMDGRIQVVNCLLKLGADPFLKGRYGRNSLHWASISGNIHVIEVFLSHGVEVDSRDWSGKTPLMYAASLGKEEAVTYLLHKGANPLLESNLRQNLLHFSLQGGSLTIINAMLSHGVDIPNHPCMSVTNDPCSSVE